MKIGTTSFKGPVRLSDQRRSASRMRPDLSMEKQCGGVAARLLLAAVQRILSLLIPSHSNELSGAGEARRPALPESSAHRCGRSIRDVQDRPGVLSGIEG